MGYQDEVFRKREQTLLATALKLFQKHGWEQVTVAQVADAAGIGKGTVYKHFATKDEIYARLALDFSQRCLEAYRRQGIGDQALASMRAVIRLSFDLMHQHPTEVQLSLHCERPEFQERLGPRFQSRFAELEVGYTRLFNELLEAAVARGEIPQVPIESVFWGIEAGFHGVMARVAAGGFGHWSTTPDMARYFDHVADFMIAGLLGASAIGATLERQGPNTEGEST
ncbi:TetR/AcrR family transcriptional regulator [Marinobacter salicampi]|uniref:TetR/AcrR family transcriptional regulator n=1 Tax=Marinobacter salicampi TaxID=435907 RepID=UPI00140D4E60|nr:TetR/AcrR family transcriptional regulator [Marinobacter salicampi]